ncbi:zf-DHHC-domain-containing protein [Mollisia scopiformis]|uniref:Palmitoyltransferase PFA4 n=1 Tax=Mollisia scopiformis TaxID=149040 RepID=A0A194XWN1_MOLSC|nr:zf-DHHC-domain-containing protein [Mollisia scopiformis]KUJ24137.1 zf-DHHC-domain-containing protein [Mollisia scopiformis]
MPILQLPILGDRIRVPAIEDLAIPAVSGLILFLTYSSQYLFHYIEPGPLTKGEAIWFNVLVGCVWWCYDCACTVDPGEEGWVGRGVREEEDEDEDGEVKLRKGMRWCKKCEAVKPPRAHHCRKCGRCIPKMDHHCPWTTNCVSHTTFPHFIRFVFYAVVSMAVLAYHLFIRLSTLWTNRNLPSYLGPPVWALAHLFILAAINSFTLFALSILLSRAVYSLIMNTTMIESWEIERHEALVERSRKTGGYVYANGGQKVRVERQEFPYDIGIWKNLCQALGTSNILLWLLPFGGGPGVESGLEWEENGFEEEGKTWPPPDPDKMPRATRKEEPTEEREYGTLEEEKEAFRRRQQDDYKRWVKKEFLDEKEAEGDSGSEGYEYEEGIDGEPGWTNSDGDRLRDYGVDEEAEIIADDDDIPLGELLRRRKARVVEDE